MMREDFVEDSKVHAFVLIKSSKKQRSCLQLFGIVPPRALCPGYLRTPKAALTPRASTPPLSTLPDAEMLLLDNDCPDSVNPSCCCLTAAEATPAAAASPQQTPQGDIDAHYRAVYIRIHI